jgi:hypothetical protein
MPNECRKYCDRVGHVMNYGEGVYGGLFISAMYAAAFFEKDPERIVRAGVAILPPESITARALGDVLRLRQENPTDWQKTWAEFNRRWDEKNEPCPAGHGQPYNIDAFVNSAYVAIGLLYGGGDFKQSTAIATACGQDSDCNAASAAGILGTALGYEALPADWRAELEKVQNGKFSYTNYSFDSIVASSLKRAGEAVVRGGGQVRDGKLFIPQTRPVPPALETWTGATKTKD